MAGSGLDMFPLLAWLDIGNASVRNLFSKTAGRWKLVCVPVVRGQLMKFELALDFKHSRAVKAVSQHTWPDMFQVGLLTIKDQVAGHALPHDCNRFRPLEPGIRI